MPGLFFQCKIYTWLCVQVLKPCALPVRIGIETKNNNMFFQSYVRTTKKQHCISVAGVILWNSLINNVRNSYICIFLPRQSTYIEAYKNYFRARYIVH